MSWRHEFTPEEASAAGRKGVQRRWANQRARADREDVRTCQVCARLLPRAMFPTRAQAFTYTCVECRRRQFMLNNARERAKRRGLDFAITVADVVIPERCPLLGISLRRGTAVVGDRSPSLDRKDPALGYLPGNVWVISHRANTIKQDATLEELKRLVVALESAGGV